MTVSYQCQSIQCTITGVFRQTWHNHKGKDLEYFLQKNFLFKSLPGFPTYLPEREWNTSSGSLLQTWRGWERNFNCAFERKPKALGAAFNFPCCFFIQPCAQRFQDSTASRPADLGLRFPSTQTAEYLQTFYFTWIDHCHFRLLEMQRKSGQGFQKFVMGRQTLSQLLHFLCSLKRWSLAQLKSFSHISYLF